MCAPVVIFEESYCVAQMAGHFDRVFPQLSAANHNTFVTRAVFPMSRWSEALNSCYRFRIGCHLPQTTDVYSISS